MAIPRQMLRDGSVADRPAAEHVLVETTWLHRTAEALASLYSHRGFTVRYEVRRLHDGHL